MIAGDAVSISTDSSTLASGAKFLSVFTATDLKGLETDGLLGLSPTFVSKTGQGELYLTTMAKNGIIKKAVFSMRLRESTATSMMWFGGYDEATVKGMYVNTSNATYAADKTAD